MGSHRRRGRRITVWTALVPVVAVLAGVMFAASGQAARGTSLRSEVTGVPDLIRERSLANRRAAAQVDALRQQVAALSDRQAPENSRLASLTRESERLAPAAGITAVRGPGVTVTLNDSQLTTDQLPDWANVNDIVIHQQDVQAVVNALWRGGAEAMTIMDQRIISTSAVRCVGNTLLLQGRVYSPPFTITAIGDPDALQRALDQDRQITIFKQYVAQLGLGYDVERRDDVTLPAYVGGLTLTSARPGA